MNVIVSRHAAAIEFIRQSLSDFKDAKVIESATPDDVRGNVVAGNLPLHLAALASQVIAVEFAGALPRGTEYGVEEMRVAGARLARYTVALVPEPLREINWSDGQGNCGRRKQLLFGLGDRIFQFGGSAVPGVLAVASSHHTKNGKWSHTDYVLRLATGAWSFVASQS